MYNALSVKQYSDQDFDVAPCILLLRSFLSSCSYLAEAEGHTEESVTMLVCLGCGHEAANQGQKYMGTTDEVFVLAKVLYEQGRREQRLQIAEHRLTLPGYRASLAKWLREQAASIGEKMPARATAEYS